MAETENRKLDPDEMFAALSKKISDSGMDMDMGRIEAAYNMAKLAHSGQLRKDGSPYVTHCVAAADIAADMGLDEDSIVAALLHDVIEDTDLTHSDIAKQPRAMCASRSALFSNTRSISFLRRQCMPISPSARRT